jgi:hypothetical protein
MTSQSTTDLLSFVERMPDNHSSAKLAAVLDTLIFKFLHPIMFNTDHVEQTLVEMLPFVYSNARRKFSNMERPLLIDGIASVIAGKNKKEKFKILRSLRLERTIYFNCFSSFVTTTSKHQALLEEYLKTPRKNKTKRFDLLLQIKTIEKNVGLRPNKSLYSVRMKTIYWADRAYDFKKMLVEKFIRLSFVEAKKAASETGLSIDEEQLFKDLVIAVHKAIDKFDSEKGTLTSFIKWWFMDAKTPYRNAHEYNTAFSMPTAQRKLMLGRGQQVGNLSVEMSDDTVKDIEYAGPDLLNQLIENENDTRVSNIAAMADEYKLACIVNDIHYIPNEKELAMLKSTIKQNGK